MMISPTAYIERFKNIEYLDLIKERDKLLVFIRDYEAKDMVGDRSGEEWEINPTPRCSLHDVLRVPWQALQLYARKI